VVLPACVPPSLGEDFESRGASSALTVYDVQRGLAEVGSTVRLGGLVATTARGPDDRVFYAQDPAGGPESGIRIELEHPTPGVEVAVGDEVTVWATVLRRYGELYLMVEDMDSLVARPGEPVVPSVVASVADWGAWNAVVVELVEARAVGCGDARGAVPLELGLDLDPWAEPVSVGSGDVFSGLTGLVVGQNERWELRLRPGDGPEAVERGEGCGAELVVLRESWPVGRVQLAGAVVTAVYGGGFFVQQDGLGLEVVAVRGLPGLIVGDEVSVEGVADSRDGRDVLRLDVAELAVVTGAGTAEPRELLDTDIVGEGGLFDEEGQPRAVWDGALVSRAGVQLEGEVALGRVATDLGVVLDDALYEGLPEDGRWDLVGVLRVVGDEVLLLPRGPEDVVASGDGAGADGE
jgi:hypothetical protein